MNEMQIIAEMEAEYVPDDDAPFLSFDAKMFYIRFYLRLQEHENAGTKECFAIIQEGSQETSTARI